MTMRAFCAPLLLLSILTIMFFDAGGYAEELELNLSYQTETLSGTQRYHRQTRDERWNPRTTAVIVCDMWDSHHSVNAVRRVAEVAPRMNQFISSLRHQGATIIHAPSDCMTAYQDHPARKRVTSIKLLPDTPQDIDSWCDQIPSEESVAYPLDQSDGGEDDDPLEHEQWAATLEAEGRNPKTPWLRQTSIIEIDGMKDFISDKGPEIWSILGSNKIENVMLLGVHTNMCVLGRPFGLRQLARHGKNVVLVRDLTDTMYNPKSWPYVNHFSGNDLIIDHIERFICPTITSDQVLGDEPFRFQSDSRKHVVFLVAEHEYETASTLSKFVKAHLQKDFRVSFVFGPEPVLQADPKQGLLGLDALENADVMVLSVRRKPLPPHQLAKVQAFVRSGKPVIGIRTANHAFLLRDRSTPEGTKSWEDLDQEVFGGSYTNHHSNLAATDVSISNVDLLRVFLPDEESCQGIEQHQSKASLYQVLPLQHGARVILNGSIEGYPLQPIAWTFVRKDGGRSFYTSLGHASDFESATFNQLLLNAIRWSVDLSPVSSKDFAEHAGMYQNGHGRQRK